MEMLPRQKTARPQRGQHHIPIEIKLQNKVNRFMMDGPTNELDKKEIMTNNSFVRRVRVFILSIGLLFQFQNPVFGQEGEGGESSDILSDSMNDVYLVVGAGLGGAVLGLSTLSFVDEPSENLKNVVVGGALGLIVGVG
jgi:hypothetical protein